MASWKDGAAYAPIERPDGFATPLTPPLPAAAPWRPGTVGAAPPPQRFHQAPQPPLAALGHQPPSNRDPRAAFAVSSLLLAPPGLRGPRRDPRVPIVTSAVTSPVSPPTGLPLPGPGPSALVGPHGWGPPPTPGLPPGPPGPSADLLASQRQLAVIAAVLCSIGLFVPVTAPFVLIVAGLIGLRSRDLTGHTGAAALIVGLSATGIQWLISSLSQGVWGWALCSLGFSVMFLVHGLRRPVQAH